MLRTSGADERVASLIRQRLHALNGNGGVRIERMDDVVAALERPWRSNLVLFGIFAAVTVFLAAAGLYAMLAYTVLEQAREIGVRLVRGASPRRVAADVLAVGAWVIAVGSIAGLALSLMFGRLMRSLLFEISPLDPLALAAATVALALVAALACVWPAIRAAHIEPAVCLRAE